MIHILGKTYVPGPPSGGAGFTAAEAWVQATVGSVEQHPMRVAGAALGLCCPKLTTHTLAAHGYDILGFGGAVYGDLRKAGATAMEIADAAAPCFPILRDLVSPTEKEVRDNVDFSKGGGGSTP